jgi:hypothetical protein
VKFSRALRWLLVLLFPLTLGWKLAVKPIDPNKIKYSIVEFLTQHDFKIDVTGETLVDIPAVEASLGACHLLVGSISPYGIHTEMIQHLGTATDRRFFVFRGTVYNAQPVLLTIVNHLTLRLLRDLGLASGVPPVLAVVSTCDVELPWSELRHLA